MYLASKGRSVGTSGQPEVSYFLSMYKKFSMYTTQTIDTVVDQNLIDFGKTVRLTVPRKGDLVKTLFLKMTVKPPTKYIQYRGGVYTPLTIGWLTTKAPGGLELFEYIDLYIGDTRIERLTPEIMRTRFYYNMQFQNLLGLQDIVGTMFQPAQFTSNSADPGADINFIQYLLDKPASYLVPLPFYFFDNNPSALPLCALTKQEISIEFKIVQKDQYAVAWAIPDYNFSYFSPQINAMSISDFTMPVEYVYVSDEERDYFMKTRLDYFINQNQIQEEFFGTDLSKRFQLKFANQVKELFFVVTCSDCEKSDVTFLRNQQTTNQFNWFQSNLPELIEPRAYGTHHLSNVEMTFNNETYLSKDVADYNFLLYVQPLLNHTNCSYPDVSPSNYVYNYSFALDPADNNPTGSANFNAIKDVYLEVNLNPVDPTLYVKVTPPFGSPFILATVSYNPYNRKMIIIARSINVLTIENGVAKLALNNNLQI